MIDFLAGKLVTKNPTSVVVQNAGIGFDLQISINTFQQLPQAGEDVLLKTYLHVREDILQLYAFADDRERSIFKGLIGVSGVGPKLAQTILSGIRADELLVAISSDDVERLTTISGVGKKTAQRLVIELKEKFKQMGLVADLESPSERLSAMTATEEEAMMALISLGYKKPAVEKALIRVRKNGKTDSVEEVIKQALQQI